MSIGTDDVCPTDTHMGGKRTTAIKHKKTPSAPVSMDGWMEGEKTEERREMREEILSPDKLSPEAPSAWNSPRLNLTFFLVQQVAA